MPTIKYTAGQKKVIGTVPADDFEYTVTQQPSTVGGFAGTEIVQGVTYDTQTGSVSKNDFNVAVSAQAIRNVKIDNLTPSIISVDSAGNVSLVDEGVAELDVNVYAQGKQRYSQTMDITGGATVRTNVNSLQAGTLRRYLYDQMELLLAGNTPGTGQKYYTDSTYTTKVTPSFTDKVISGFDSYPIDRIDIRIWLTDNVFIHPNGNSHGYVPAGVANIDYVEFWVSTLTFAPGGRGIEPRTTMPPADFESYSGEPNYLCPIPLLARLQHTYNAVPETDLYWISPVDYFGLNRINAPGSQNSAPGPLWPVFPGASLRPTFSRNTVKNYPSGPVYNFICIGGDSFSPIFTGIHGTLIPMGIVATEGGGIDYFPALMVDYQAACDLLHTNNGIATQAITTINLSTWFPVV